MKKIIRERLHWFLIISASLFTFWNLPKTFYQQDEWQTVGYNLVQGFSHFFSTSPLLLVFGEQRPFSFLMYALLLGFFKFNAVPAILFAIIFHILNSVLVFYLVEKISKKQSIAFVAALFFVASSVSHQAITWISAINTLPAASLILISIITYFKYLEKANRRYLSISFLSAILSIYFKGTGLFLFVLLPLIPFIYKNKHRSIKNIIRLNFPLLIFGLLMILTRIGQVFFRSEKVAGFVNRGDESSFVLTVFIHTILYPLTSLFQIFVPPADLYGLTQSITTSQYKFLVGSPLKDLVAQSVVADLVAILGSVTILVLFGFMAIKNKDKTVGRNILFAILLFFLSLFPYMALDRDSSYLSSRYFYVSAIPAGILFGYVIYFLVKINKYLKWIVLFSTSLYIFHHASIVRQDINYQVSLGEQRKAVLKGIKDIYPNLEKNSIFYVTSDKKFYGEVTNPFQNGLGYVLEIWYYDSGNVPPEFLKNNFLWDLGSEGYQKKGDKGFGYYQDMDKMITDMKKNKFDEDSIHAFFIKSNEKEIIDITQETRERISTLSATQ